MQKKEVFKTDKMDLIKNVKNTIKKERLISKGDTVIVGVSGGPDSVALLLVLTELQLEFGYKIKVAHVDHNLRKTSAKDSLFTEKLAENLNLPFVCKKLKKSDIRKSSSVEDQARKARLRFFNEVAKKETSPVIALAHTMDDQAETVLMRILRGSGLNGIRAIHPKRDINGITFIRPAINTTKDSILKFLKKRKAKYRIDHTNKKIDFFRNKIRLKLLPILEKEYNPNVKEALVNLAEIASEDYRFLEQVAEKTFKKKICSLSKKKISFKLYDIHKMHISQQRLIIRNTLSKLKGNTNKITLKHIQEIKDLVESRPVGSVVNLPSNISAKKTSETIVISKK